MSTTNKDTARSFFTSAKRAGWLLSAAVGLAGIAGISIEPNPAYGADWSPNTISTCGNGVIDSLELCDDGNLIDDDGCDWDCRPSGIAAMSLGDGSSCAVTNAGNTKCWGRNDVGQLGRGDDIQIGDDEVPSTAAFIDLGGHAREIHTNGEQTFALMDSGVVRAWGANGDSQLGLMHEVWIGDDEAPAWADVPVDIELGAPALELAVGEGFACALLEGGAIRCWGANYVGQLGYGHTERIGDDEAPADVDDVELGQAAVSVVAGARHACALLVDDTVYCWGSGEFGQLGYGSTEDIGDDEPPTSRGPVDVGEPVAELVAGAFHTCAGLRSGGVRCWGSGGLGQLGYGSTEDIGDDEVPASAGDVPLDGVVVQLATGSRHTCAVLSGGRLRCWGDGREGQLGYGDTQIIGDDETPDEIADVELGSQWVTAVFIGPLASSTCVQLDRGPIRCWGYNDDGELGYGDTMSRGGSVHTGPVHLSTVAVADDSDD